MLKIIHQKILDKRWGVLAVAAQSEPGPEGTP